MAQGESDRDGLPPHEEANSPGRPADGRPEIRTALIDHWQKAALDLVQRGLSPVDVFETAMTVGLAGVIETRGKRDAARQLLHLAEQLASQLRREAADLQEAQRAIKN